MGKYGTVIQRGFGPRDNPTGYERPRHQQQGQGCSNHVSGSDSHVNSEEILNKLPFTVS